MPSRDLEMLEFPRVLEAIASAARSDAGRAAVRALRPCSDPEVAAQRLDTVAELVALTRASGRAPTADLPLLAPILSAAQPEGAALEPLRLAEIRDVLLAGHAVRRYLRTDADRFPHLTDLAATIVGAQQVEDALVGALDDHGQIRDDASPELAEARAITRKLRAQIESRLLQLVRDPEQLSVIGENYVTIRNGRFVVPVRTAAVQAISGVVQDRSASGETIFVEPLFAVELNNRLLLAARDEEAAERRVRLELTALVHTHASALAALEETLATVDAHSAAAHFALVHDCNRPLLGSHDVALLAARHPLLLIAARPVVAVDLRIGAEQRGIVITGPNAGGKTVALKTLGLCALMAHAGLLIPAAEGSRLPVLTAVLADIGDDQSIDRNLSTFSAHAENLARIARAAGPQTLALLDEPGVGTDPIEGAALAVGVLTDLLARGPLLVVTSHYPQVKTFALAEPQLEVAAFDVDPTTGTPRFRLTYHTVGQSLALPIARRHGVPARALEVAERLLSGESQELVDAVRRLEESRRTYEERRATLEEERTSLAAERVRTETLLADLHARQRRRWADDLEESRQFLRDLQERGRTLLAELRAKPDAARLRTFVQENEAAITDRRPLMTEPRPSGRAPVVGDTVEVVERGIRGELIEVNGERARIRRGGLKFEVSFADLHVVADAAVPRERVAVALAEVPEPAEEINLVGRRVRDAVETLDGFLDRATRTGVNEVRVVHGIGSGALRRAVHEYLATSPYCAGLRDADPAEGGGGVTIATLR